MKNGFKKTRENIERYIKKMGSYLIEFRINGYGKKYAKRLIYDVAKRFHVKGVTHKRVVPHITLFGPFNTNNQRAVVGEVEKIGRKYTLVPFEIKGFSSFNNWTNKVVYLDIEPSKQMEELRYALAQSLLHITNTKSSFDKDKNFKFHSTIAFKDIDRKFKQIVDYFKQKEEPNIKQHLLRITILRDAKILYEYDLIQKKLLNRDEARSKFVWHKTIGLFRNICSEESHELEHEEPDEEDEDNKTWRSKVSSFFFS